MPRILVMVLLLAAFGSSAAVAQTAGGTSTVVKNQPQPAPSAPVGHRQPRAGDVPDEKNLSDPNTAANKADAALDRKIKSICRGC